MSDNIEFEEAECPVCGGPLMALGGLGNMMHYRCRDCGSECSRDVRKPGGDNAKQLATAVPDGG